MCGIRVAQYRIFSNKVNCFYFFLICSLKDLRECQTGRRAQTNAPCLLEFLSRFPIIYALVTINAEAGETEAAIGYAEKLLALVPGDPGARELLERLRAAAS